MGNESREEPTSTGAEHDGFDPADLGHPRGTLAIVIVYGLLFALGWLAFYFVGFTGQGTTH